MKIVLGFIVALGIGVFCRLAIVPLPAPPVIIGALLVVAMTLGYIAADRFLCPRQAKHRHLCGGPSGETVRGENEL